MTTYKLDDICRQGDFCNAFIFHISGYPWAATNSAELKTLFDAGDAQASSLRSAIFSNFPAGVQMLQILDNNLGSQTVSYDENKGLNVGGFSVNLFSNPSGFQFQNGVSVESVGVMGLNWQPNRTTNGFSYAVLGEDLNCDTASGSGELVWANDRDFGLWTWIQNNFDTESGSYTEDLVVWVGSSCLLLTGTPVNINGFYRVDVQSQCWNAPNEFIPQRVDRQNIYITNFPQSIQGQTASLWGYHIDKDGALNTTSDGYLLRHGKCKANSRIGIDGTWQVNVGSATDSLKFKLKRNSFRGHLSGYLFNSDDYEGYNQFGELGYNVWHRPHVSMVRFAYDYVTSVFISADFYSGDLNSGTEFFTYDIVDIVDYLADTLNSISPAGVEFAVSNGDIVYEDSNEAGNTRYYYMVNGPSVKVGGVGYVSRFNLIDYLNECTSRNPAWMSPLEKITNLTDERWFKTGDIPVSLRRTDEDDLEDMNTRPFYDYRYERTLKGENHEFTKARGWCAYYYPFPLGRPTREDLKAPEKSLYDQSEKNEPLTSTNDTFSYISSNESTLVADDIIQFGESGLDLEIFCKVDETDLTASTFNSANALVTGMGWGFTWNRGIQEALTADKAYISEIARQFSTSLSIGVGPAVNDHLGKTASDFYSEKQIKDTFELIGKSNISDAEPVDILKGLLGDPSSSLNIPESIKQTSIGYLFDRGTATAINREFIDFDALQNVIDNAQYTGVTYQFPFFENDSDSMDMIQLMQGLLNTHGGKMIYVWDEDSRGFKISFISGFNTGLAEAINAGRDFNNSYIARNGTPAIDGGDWSYNRIAAKYKNRDGGHTNLNISLEDSRVQHTLQDKIFNIKDPFTVMQTSVDDFDTQIIEKMSSLLQSLATVDYTQQINFKIKTFPRLVAGIGHVINWEGLLNRETGKTGEQVFGDVKRITYNFNDYTILASVTTRTIRALSIAPSMAATVSGTPGTSSITLSFDTTTASQEFQDTSKGLTDAGYFDCYNYIESTGEVEARECSCTDYGVVFFLRRQEDCRYDSTYTNTNQNVYRGTISVPIAAAQLDNGTQSITITYDTALAAASGHNVATNMPNGTEVIVLFEARDGENLQSCQTRAYGWLGDTEGKVTNSTSGKSLAITVGN